MNKTALSVLIGITSISLLGCSYFAGAGKDNQAKPTPLVNFAPSMNFKPVWTGRAGNGTANMQLMLPLAAEQGVLYVSNYDGAVAAYQVSSGKKLWSSQTKTHLTSGPGVGQNLLVVGSDVGQIIALDKQNGHELWRSTLSSQIQAVPQIEAQQVIAQTVDGRVYGLDAANGQVKWQYVRATSQYMLRASSTPLITQNTIIAGFSDGKLLALNLNDGHLLWERTLAIPQGMSLLQKLIDLDTNPLAVDNTLYMAGYQGNLIAMSIDGKHLYWQRPFSTYHNLATAGKLLFAVDTEGQIWAFDRQSGRVSWQQAQLKSRRITGVSLYENTLVVGDGEGYLHWFAVDDGHLLSRVKVGGDAILANPIVVDDKVIALSKSGKITAYRRA